LVSGLLHYNNLKTKMFAVNENSSSFSDLA
jgi:hypothetical protein